MVKKEATIAIFIGLVIGLVITGGILRAQNAFKNIDKSRKSDSSTTTTSNNNNSENSSLILSINSPADNSIVSENSVTLTGQTIAGTYIAIVAEKGEHLIIPNDLGSFSQEIDLVKGANIIQVTVYTEAGDKLEKTINIVYTTAEI